MPVFSSVNIISKWSWCPVFRCFVQTKLFELDGSSCFSFISRGGWYSLMRPRRFHFRLFSDFELISRNSSSVSLLFFYLSIIFFLIPAQPWIWWTHQEVSSNCCCLFVMKKPELDLVHMDFFLPLILHIFLREWHLKTKERSWFVIGVKAPFRRTTIVFVSSRCCHCNYVLASWSVRVEVFRSLGSRGPRSDLVLVPWSWVG